MTKKLTVWLFLATLILSNDINSRPISYADSWTLMQMNNYNKHSFHLHYSPSVNYSVGYKGEYWLKNEWQFHAVQINYLINRINKPKSQTNIYLKNGLGLANSKHKDFDSKTEPSFFSGLSMDWEDRKFFLGYENRINYNPTIDRFFLQKARIGFAPYVGKYGDLHSWLMLQIDHMPKAENKIVYSPILRMFKGDYLAELGLTNYKDFMFNFIKRF